VSADEPGGVIDLAERLARVREPWSPRIVGEANGQYLKLARGEGTLEWHSHADEDEVFLCLEGRLVLELRDREVALGPGQLFVVPRGVEHRPRAEPTASILLFEPRTTLHLGGMGGEREVAIEDQARD
jgi:mannose-6-phosphate isomerase-like protein (cupin superfamily)